jgi:hypothetical protein
MSQSPKTRKKWTLMFYFAGDNTLDTGMIRLLKDLKEAGWHEDVNVIVQFDPSTAGVPAYTLEINRHQPRQPPGHPLFGSVLADALPPDEAPDISDQTNAGNALKKFLGFCAACYPAERYMLFLVGHGLPVAGLLMLRDENPPSHVTVPKLGSVLKNIPRNSKDEPCLELVSFHSCSISALEVAYQMQGRANYLLASQSSSFMGSWPYERMLRRFFQAVNDGTDGDVCALAEDFHSYCTEHNEDMAQIGFPFEVTLCDLRQLPKLRKPLERLVSALVTQMTAGMDGCRLGASVTDLIVHAHWEAQSYWGEWYTDLSDFCAVLKRKCKQQREFLAQWGHPQEEVKTVLSHIEKACAGVVDVLSNDSEEAERIIRRAHFVGPDFQYSHGLSVYFPWAEPERADILADYRDKYKLVKEFKPGASWLDFLVTYFDATMRAPRNLEGQPDWRTQARADWIERHSLGKDNPRDPLGKDNPRDPLGKDNPRDPLGKDNPRDPMGGDCKCSLLKNYPRIAVVRGRTKIPYAPKCKS